ncbi:MAG: FIST C-terminal domain-containing protein [Proteobacteria bacterium]|nr:FIST C-terminal domain-containing protein [Pseudomonadota bacterium]
MKVETFHYKKVGGWSVKSFPPLDSENTLILAFCAPEFFNNCSPLQDLKKAYPLSKIAGCSTAGEILDDTINDHSISVAVTKFEKSQIKIINKNIDEVSQSKNIGKSLTECLKGENLKGIIVLSDGLIVNGTELVKGIKENLDPRVIITGGLAGDGNKFQRTWTLQNEKPVYNGITAIGLYGKDIEIGFGSKGGWDIFGPEKLITRSQGNILYEIDGEPALAIYKKYLGDRAKDLPASGLLFPLSIRESSASENKVVRTILGIDENNQSMIFAGDIPQGWYAQLMKANFDRLVEAASIASKLATSEIKMPQETLNLAISCVGRRLVLGERTIEEVEASLENLGKNPAMIGFYSYGEISPSGLLSSDLHNQTMTLTIINEK